MTRYATGYGVFCIEAIPNQPQLAHCHSFFVKADQRPQEHRVARPSRPQIGH